MSRFFTLLVLFIGFLGPVSHPVAAAGEPAGAAAAITFKKDTVSVKKADGKTLDFSVEIAEKQAQREEGLKHRNRLPEDQGMLFLFEEDTYVEMWMKDTPIPLDILFLDSAGKVVHIAPKTVPNSTTIISARREARGVLELAAGVAEKNSIKVGDQVIYPFFRQ
jgi:uncharacterized membrane protein (UPF0127 family)